MVNLTDIPYRDLISFSFIRQRLNFLSRTEPTVRKDLQDIVEALGEMPNLKQIGMTSNGIALKRKLSKLQRAGLTHINISLDTLKPEKFFLLTRRDGFSKVMESIHEAVQLGFNPVKINNVLMRGEFLSLAL
tara:strand:- start:120 stop:515 length:396 start_codon:yes stop_codon:yes gene_type:complete